MVLESGHLFKRFQLKEVLRNDTSQTTLLGTIEDSDCIIKMNPIHFDLYASGLWNKLSLNLKSESGAEYHFYDAFVSLITMVMSEKRVSYGVEVIWPANKNQVARARPNVPILVEETPAMFEGPVTSVIEAEIGNGSSLSWINNVLNETKEKERLLCVNPDPEYGYIVNVDTKWLSHPDCNLPREEWGITDVTHLYCLGIVRRKGLRCIRDLRQPDAAMLRGMLDDGLGAIKQLYGLESDVIRVFIHHHPTVHFVHVKNDIGISPEKCHLLTNVIQNLELDTSYYTKRTLKVWLREGTRMHKAVKGGMDPMESK